MRGTRRLVRALVGALLLGTAATAAPPATPQPAAGGLIEGGDTPELVLLYTGDVIGYVDPCG